MSAVHDVRRVALVVVRVWNVAALDGAREPLEPLDRDSHFRAEVVSVEEYAHDCAQWAAAGQLGQVICVEAPHAVFKFESQRVVDVGEGERVDLHLPLHLQPLQPRLLKLLRQRRRADLHLRGHVSPPVAASSRQRVEGKRPGTTAAAAPTATRASVERSGAVEHLPALPKAVQLPRQGRCPLSFDTEDGAPVLARCAGSCGRCRVNGGGADPCGCGGSSSGGGSLGSILLLLCFHRG